MSKTSLAVDQEDRRRIRIAAARRNRTIQDMTHEIITAGLQQLAPEVFEPEYNAASNVTPAQFMELYRGEEATLSRPLLRRTRRG